MRREVGYCNDLSCKDCIQRWEADQQRVFEKHFRTYPQRAKYVLRAAAHIHSKYIVHAAEAVLGELAARGRRI